MSVLGTPALTRACRGSAYPVAAVTSRASRLEHYSSGVVTRTATQYVESDVAPDAVWALLADPRRIPEWAPAFADSVSGDVGSGWRVAKEGRDFALRVAVSVDARTVDYLREIGPGTEGGAYIRVLPRPGDGCVIVMTLPTPPGGDSAAVAATLHDELIALARLVAET